MIKRIVLLTLFIGFLFSQVTVGVSNTSRKVPLFGLNNSSMRYNNYNNGPIYTWSDAEFKEAALCFKPQIIRYPGGNESSYWDWINGWVLPPDNIIDHVDSLGSLFYGEYHDDSSNGDFFFDISSEEYNWWDNSDGTWNPAMISVTDFSDFINENYIQGTYVINMLTEDVETITGVINNYHQNGVAFQHFELGNEYYLRSGGDKWDDLNGNYVYDAGDTLTKDNDGDGLFDPGRYEFIYPSPLDYGQECNTWIDSLSQTVPNAKYALTVKNRPGDPRSYDWNRQVLEEIDTSLLDTVYLAWHEYLTYRHNDDIPLTPEQILVFPEFRLTDLLRDGGMHQDTISLLQDSLGIPVRLWLTESNYREREFGSVNNQPWIFRWAHTLVNVIYFSLIIENPYVEMMLLHSLHGWSTTSSINHGNGFPQDFPVYDNQDSCSPYGRTASGFSTYFWNDIADGMTHMQRLVFSSSTNEHLGIIDNDPANSGLSPDSNFVFSYLHGWKLYNSMTNEEKAILINIADSAKTIQFDAANSVFNHPFMKCISVTHQDSSGIPSIDQYVTGDGDLTFDTTEVVSGMVLPPYSINLFEYNLGGNTWYVSTTGSDSTGDGSQGNPFATIQTGINSASDGDMVSVAAGTYMENINFNKKNIAVISELGSDSTTIDGMDSASVAIMDSTSNAELIGFHLTNGHAPGGGGVKCTAGSIHLEDLIISGNQASYGSGIIGTVQSQITADHLLIYNNSNAQGMSGIAGLYFRDGSSISFNHCTIVNDFSSATNSGNSIKIIGETSLSLNNTVLWNLSSGNVLESFNGWGEDTINVSFSNIEGGIDSILQTGGQSIINWGVGNIDANPLFCNSDSSDFTLAENSPCVGTGENGTNIGAFDEGCDALSVVRNPIPRQFALHQNYPNPFNPTTILRYDLPVQSQVTIIIYDLMGRVVSNLVSSQQNAGYKSIQWNATNNLGEPVSAGMYIYMVQAGQFRQVRKMVLLK